MKCPGCKRTGDRSVFVGYEFRGVYDGVLVWQCDRCGHAFPRFEPEDGRERLHRTGSELAQQLNMARKVGQ